MKLLVNMHNKASYTSAAELKKDHQFTCWPFFKSNYFIFVKNSLKIFKTLLILLRLGVKN